jgi:microcystin-dependent protein
MALETASFINQLNAANPLSTDPVSQADDHIRLIKATIKNTFPNITSPVTATGAQLSNPVPAGVIVMWSGSIAGVPSGWALCDGTNGTPNLRDRFVVGAGTTYAVGATGGSTTSGFGGGHTHTENTAGSHSHGGTSGLHALTLAQIPAHTHSYSALNTTGPHPTGSGSTEARGNVTTNTSGSAGSGQAHNHTISLDGSHSHTINAVGDHTHSAVPPYYALAYIMKT